MMLNLLITRFKRSEQSAASLSNFRFLAASLLALAVLLLGAACASISAHAQSAYNLEFQHVLPFTSPLLGPTGVAADAKGNIYIADPDGNVILKQSPNANGNGYTATQIITLATPPVSVAVDTDGNIYFTDGTGGHVYKETLSGGNYTFSSLGSGWTQPTGIAVDSAGVVYVTDYATPGVYTLTLSGSNYTQATIGSGWTHPGAIALDQYGNVYVADTASVQLLTKSVSTYTQSSFMANSGVTGIAVDRQQNVYLAQGSGSLTEVQNILGKSSSSNVIETTLQSPAQIAIDSSGVLYIAESGSNADILKITNNFGSVQVGSSNTPNQTVTALFEFAGSATLGSISVTTDGNASMDFSNAGTGTCSAASTYSVHQLCSVDLKFTPSAPGIRRGAVTLLDNSGNALSPSAFITGTGVGPAADFPPGTLSALQTLNNVVLESISVDAKGNLYGVDTVHGTIWEDIVGSGWSGIITGISELGNMTVDGAGNIFYSTRNSNSAIYEAVPSPSGYQSTLLWFGSSYGFSDPFGFFVDGNENIYFTDDLSQRAFVAYYQFGYGYDTWTTPTVIASGFVGPVGIVADASGNAYIADDLAGNLYMETYTPTGYVQSTLDTNLNQPYSLSIDSNGNLYVLSWNNQAIYKYTSTGGSFSPRSTYFAITAPNTLQANMSWTTMDSLGNTYFVNGAASTTVYKLDASDAPSLQFESTDINQISADSPKTVTLNNYGNGPLAFEVIASGNNPSISDNFLLNSSAANACPLVLSTASSPGTIPAGAACELPVSFQPSTVGNISGTLVVTDDSLNQGAPNYVTQTIDLNGVGLALPQVATPTFSPAAGTYTSTQNVTISDTTTGATIYYTTNGSTPTTSSTKYTGAVQVSASETLSAIAVASGYTNSAVGTAAYIINIPQVATPTFSPAAGTYTAAQSVTISDTTTGATIYYTTNGSTPTTSSTKYTGAVQVSASETLSAIAVATGYTNSAVGTAAYIINIPQAATPTFSPAAGTYTAVQNVTISDTTTGATIYYTTNGSTPTTSSTKYTGAVQVSSSETLNAIAVATGYTNSKVGTAAYIINIPQAATPTFSPAAGTYTAAQSVTISDTTTGATIYYTTNGSTPTTSSSKYTGAVQVSASETLSAIAVATGYTNSAVGTAAYVISTPSSFSLSATPPTATVNPGQSASYTITVTPVNGAFNSAVTLSASGLPSGATASFSPASVTPGTSGATSAMTIQLPSGLAMNRENHSPSMTTAVKTIAPLLAVLLLFPFSRLRRASRKFMLALFLLISLGAVIGISGCGGTASGYFGQQPQTYTITVTGTSGALTNTTTVLLTVQ